MSIFKYTQSKDYLRHYISGLPRKGRGEISRIAAYLRVSATLVSQVLAGEKSFTTEQTQSLVTYLGLIALEADYLVFMVQHERAGSVESRKYWKAKLDGLRIQSRSMAARVQVARVLDDKERGRFYSSPLYSTIRLFTSVGDVGKSIADICERFDLPRVKAAEMLKFLVSTGLCLERNDRYFLGAQSTHLEQGSPDLLRHYANWRLRAIRQGEDLTEKELMYTAPVSLSRNDFDLLREEMVEFIKKFLKQVHASPAEEVACFNLDFFWIRK